MVELIVPASPLQAGDKAVVDRGGGAPANVDLSVIAANPQSGTSYGFAAADVARLVTMSNASANVATIQSHSAAPIPVGSMILIACTGLGTTTVAAASGVTLNGIDGGAFDLDGPAECAMLYQIATDAWLALNRSDVA